MSVHGFCPFSNWTVGLFFTLGFKYLGTSSFSDTLFANIFLRLSGIYFAHALLVRKQGLGQNLYSRPQSFSISPKLSL